MVTRAFYALLRGEGIPEAARDAGVTPRTLIRWLGAGPTVAANGLPKHVPLLTAVTRARAGRSITDPLDQSEVIAAAKMMIASLEMYVPVLQRAAERLAPVAAAETPTPSAAKEAQ